MSKLTEDMFRQCIEIGVISSVQLRFFENGKASISYTLQNLASGSIHTKRGSLKSYRMDTAVRFLRLCRVTCFQVDVSKWSPGGQLPID